LVIIKNEKKGKEERKRRGEKKGKEGERKEKRKLNSNRVIRGK
jgi:hypothetical protein